MRAPQAFAAALVAAACAWGQPPPHPRDLSPRFAIEVDRRLSLPDSELPRYAEMLRTSLAQAAVVVEHMQYVVVVDRNAHVQAAMVWWIAPDGEAGLIGASPASTGRPAGFEHFETPLGAFEHALAHPDFRAEGTRNEFGIRGYGERGLRVFDFGWVMAPRAWAAGAQAMRLQLHATDRERLEPRLGERASKGCIRIPASLNRFIDRHGVLDAAYDEALASGRAFWVLRPDREPTPWSGRWMVVVDSKRDARPDWSPAPTH